MVKIALYPINTQLIPNIPNISITNKKNQIIIHYFKVKKRIIKQLIIQGSYFILVIFPQRFSRWKIL